MAPVLGALAIAAFPAVASAAVTLPTATPCPVVSGPCYTAPVTLTPLSQTEFTNPPEGRILTAVAGTWTGVTQPLTYQWYDCDVATGLTCTPISGATARTYTVASSDVGSRLAIVEKAVGTSVGYSVIESTGAAAQAVPINRTSPTLSGLAQDGQTLTATSPGTWGGTQPITGYTYQWDRCDSAGKSCVNTGQSSTTYLLGDSDVGHTLEVGVIAINSVGSQGATSCPVGGPNPCPAFSAVTAVVTPANNAAPTISGTAQQGKTLTVGHGSWSPSNATTSDQWQRCDASGSNCSAIAGATSPNYTLTSSDVGHTLRVQETATANGVTSSPATSGASGVVQGASSPQVVTPPPSGNPGHNGGPGSNNNNNNTSSSVNSGQIRALLVRSLAPQGKGARIRQLLKHGGYVFSFKAPSSGRLVISWYRLKGGRRILVAIATFTFHKSGTASVKLVLTGKGRRLLRGARKMKLISIGDFTPAGQGTTSAIKNITLKA